MSQHAFPTVLEFALMLLTICLPSVNGDEPKLDPDSAKAARDGLVRLDKEWKDYSNEPNLGDSRWKLKMEVLVRLAQAGPAAFPLLQDAARKGSKWSASTRQFATDFLPVLRDDKLRKTIAEYDLSQMDSARIGKMAPDVELKDATGKTHRLSQFRDKTVVLAFIVLDL